MTKRSLNLYELIFGAFFILKVTGEGIQNWNWFFVFLPLIIGLLHTFFSKVMTVTGMKRDINIVLQDMYLERKKRQARNKLLKPIEDNVKKAKH